MKPCVTCRFYKGRFLLEPLCMHEQSVDEGFTHVDGVTGETRTYEDQQQACYKARWKCNGVLHEPKKR